MCHTVVAVYAVMDFPCGIDRQVQLVAHAAHTLDVVGMVVSDKQRVNTAQRQAIILSIFLPRTYTDTGIYPQGFAISVQCIVVATAPTAKRYEFQH
jgi:hypothetical protein